MWWSHMTPDLKEEGEMQISNEDLFCWELVLAKEGAAVGVSDVLDFHAHGDDILHRLFLVVQSVGDAAGEDGALSIVWQTADVDVWDDPDDITEIVLTPVALGEDNLTEGAYLIKNMPIPHGLKRYNRLAFKNNEPDAEADAWDDGDEPVMRAFIVDGRTVPL